MSAPLPTNPIVLIWSGEYRAWWRPSGNGYTTDRDAAGRWWLADAQERTAHCGPEKRISFHQAARPPVVIAPDVPAALATEPPR